MNTISPESTLLILIGSSIYPFFKELENEALSISASKIETYFLNTFGLPKRNLKNLFNKGNGHEVIHRKIELFLKKSIKFSSHTSSPITDLFVIYIGHGNFLKRNDEFYLSIKKTRKDRPDISAVFMYSLAKTIKENAKGLRCYIILDCCFAAAGARDFQSGTLSSNSIGINAINEFNYMESGTTLLCSSSSKSLSEICGNLTMFTESLLHALLTGAPERGIKLSLQEIKELIDEYLQRVYGDEAVIPEIHTPGQSSGDISKLPIFPNPARNSFEHDPAFIEWIEELGFSTNPFKTVDCDKDSFNLLIKPFQFEQLIEHKSNVIIADKGWGKTACSHLLENHLRKENQFLKRKHFLIKLDKSHFYTEHHHKYNIIKVIINKLLYLLINYLLINLDVFDNLLKSQEINLRSILSHIDENVISSAADPQISWLGLRCRDIKDAYRKGSLNEIISAQENTESKKIRLLEKLLKIHEENDFKPTFLNINERIMSVINCAGFDTLWVIIDELPFIDFKFVKNNPNIINNRICFKIFVLTVPNLNELFETICIINIQWPREKLKEILVRRLEATSLDDMPKTSFLQIFPKAGIDHLIDDKIVESSNSPSEVIRLAEKILFQIYKNKEKSLIDNRIFSEFLEASENKLIMN